MIDNRCSPQIAPCPSGGQPITVTLSRPQLDTTVCTVTGTVDWTTRAVVKNALTQARQDDNEHLVVDLSAVTSMDSACPYTLLEARFKHHLSGGGHLAVILAPNSPVHELHLVALRASFDVHPTLADALYACASAGTTRCARTPETVT
jgi:anti-anti-sigma factor